MLSLPEIEDALERNLLELHYQPIVSLPDRGVVGLEALCRFGIPSGVWFRRASSSRRPRRVA